MSEQDKDYNFSKNSNEQEDDPVVMYLVVHEIGMSTGKLAAQVGHAVGMLYIKYMMRNGSLLTNEELQIWKEWQDGKFRKVTLTANDSKWNKLKNQLSDLSINHAMVIDAGLTEIPSGSETVIGIWPMRKSNRFPLLRKLQVLK